MQSVVKENSPGHNELLLNVLFDTQMKLFVLIWESKKTATSQAGIMRFINIDSCRLLFDVGTIDCRLNNVAVSPNGRYLVGVMDDGNLHILSLQTLWADINERPPRSSYEDDGPTCFRCGGKGHIKVGCRMRIDHLRKPLNYRLTCRKGQRVDQRPPAHGTAGEKTLIGPSTCVDVCIEGVATAALLDTGATVSTVTETFHRQKLAHLAVRPLQEVLRIECADGRMLPYLGYIQADIRVEGAGGGGDSLPCLLLVIPATRYSDSVPVQLGTNVLEQLMHQAQDKQGPQFLQDAQLQPVLHRSFRCLAMRNRLYNKFFFNTMVRS